MPTGSARGLHRYRTADDNDRDSTALPETVRSGGERSSSRGGSERERDDLRETVGKRLP